MRLSLFAVAALCVFSLAAHADSFIYSGSITFTGSSASYDSNFLTGPVAVASSQETVAATGTFYGSPVTSVQLNQGFYPGGYSIFTANGGQAGTTGMFTLAEYTTPGTYTEYFAQFNETDVLTVADVPAAPASVTPEPSSFALLGTGMLGVVGIVRKRFA